MITQFLGLPEDISANGYLIDQMLEVVHWFMLILFVGWTTFFFYILWHFRKKNNPVAQYHGFRSKITTHAEVAVVIIESILLLGFALPLWARQVHMEGEPGLRVHAVAYQFGWLFHYAGEDGKFGRRDPHLVCTANPLGIDWTDPASKDDVVSLTTLKVPSNVPVEVRVTSKDVIHNFSAHNLRVATDAIPGHMNPVYFTAIKEGDYDLICGQLCGAGHGLMKGCITVMPPAEFKDWIKNSKAIPPDQPVAQLK